MAKWPDMMEEAIKSSSIVVEHRTLMGAVLQNVRSVNSGLKDAFGGLLTGFKVNKVMLVFFVKRE